MNIFTPSAARLNTHPVPKPDLQRFITAQQNQHAAARAELLQGRKRGHWMWYIFPQLAGLGHSSTARYYALSGLEEASAYYHHPLLGVRLVEISSVLLALNTQRIQDIFDPPDDLKLHSCMTLFAAIPGASPVFVQVLQKFFQGRPDQLTLDLLKKSSIRYPDQDNRG